MVIAAKRFSMLACRNVNILNLCYILTDMRMLIPRHLPNRTPMRVSLSPDLGLSLVECDGPVCVENGRFGSSEACRSLMHLVMWLQFIGGFIRTLPIILHILPFR